MLESLFLECLDADQSRRLNLHAAALFPEKMEYRDM